ncbi:MAG: hypothetical protein ACR2OD_05990 [Gaiellaceae bacterium]
MRPRIALIGALGALVLLVIAACGGNDSGGGSSEQLTEAEYVAAADAICAEADTKLDALGEPSPDAIGSFLRDGAEIAEEQLDDLKALNGPDEIQETLDRAYELLGQLNDKAREAADAFDDGDISAANSLIDEITPLGEEADQLATDIGLEVCSGN